MDTAQQEFLTTLEASRRGYALPANLRIRAERFVCEVLGFLFPHFEVSGADADSWPERLELLLSDLRECVSSFTSCKNCGEIAICFVKELPAIREALMLDAIAIQGHDPAAESLDEVILAYPGFYAIAIFRVAHFFHGRGIPLFPRLLSEFAHRQTGIDIHPGAQIGREFSIDHGSGIVIGETTAIGERVRIFQGVTLGALSVSKDLVAVKRHPTIGNDVVIYANATILGGKTVVGDKSVIGGNVWLTQSVPPGSVVTEAATLKRQGEHDEVLLDFQI